MPLTRRAVLEIVACVPAGFLAASALTAAGRLVTRAAGGLRPTPTGTSATRCAQCGASDHTMLDPRCPAAPRVI
jgi:hypothetical protein